MENNLKIIRILFISIFFTVSISMLAQTSTAPNQNVCMGATEPYLLTPSSSTSTYQWVLNSGGTIVNGQGTGYISIDWNMVAGGPHILSVTETDINGCVGPTKTVDVTIISSDDASFVLTDYCEGSSNSASNIITSGGLFSFNPSPTLGEMIDPLTGEITGGIAGNTYTVQYITGGLCPATQIENVLIYSSPSTGPIYHN